MDFIKDPTSQKKRKAGLQFSSYKYSKHTFKTGRIGLTYVLYHPYISTHLNKQNFLRKERHKCFLFFVEHYVMKMYMISFYLAAKSSALKIQENKGRFFIA